MAKLTDEMKTLIVQQLACFDSPQQVADAVRDTFGVEIPRQQAEEYNPERGTPAKKWVALFHATRKAFLEETAKVPIAHRAVRIRKLQRMADRAESMRNYALAGQLLEQAAKEVGDAYTNRRELTGKGGGPIETRDASLDDMSDEQLARVAAKLVEELGATAH